MDTTNFTDTTDDIYDTDAATFPTDTAISATDHDAATSADVTSGTDATNVTGNLEPGKW